MISGGVVASQLQATELDANDHVAVASGGFWRKAEIACQDEDVQFPRETGHFFDHFDRLK